MISNKPLYQQIADGLMDDILAGRYPADSRIPSVREAAADAQVNVNTLMRTREQLERDGIIYNKRGIGYFVSPNAADIIIERRKKEFFSGQTEYFFSRLAQLGISPEKLSEQYKAYLISNNLSI